MKFNHISSNFKEKMKKNDLLFIILFIYYKSILDIYKKNIFFKKLLYNIIYNI